MVFPDAHQEVALVAISLAGGSDIQFAAITDTIDINQGDYPGEGIPTMAGGRIWKQSPQEDGEVTLEIYPIELDTTSGVGLFQQYNGGTIDTAEPLATDNTFPPGVSRIRDRFRIAILWTNDPAATTAEGSTAANTESLRYFATDCRITSHNADYTDDILKITVTFKFPALNKAGTVKNSNWQSGDDTALVALGSYT